MRTTAEIDDDIMKQLRDRAHKQGVSLKETLNATLRRGMADSPKSRPSSSYVCPSFSMGSPRQPLDVDHALAHAAALEDRETAHKLELRK